MDDDFNYAKSIKQIVDRVNEYRVAHKDDDAIMWDDLVICEDFDEAMAYLDDHADAKYIYAWDGELVYTKPFM